MPRKRSATQHDQRSDYVYIPSKTNAKQQHDGHYFCKKRIAVVMAILLVLGTLRILVEVPLQPTTHQSAIKPKNSIGNAATMTTVPARPLFIFGHSTGHSGTGSFHSSLAQPGCPWDNNTVETFENTVEGEKVWPPDPDCTLTWTKLVPFILSSIHNVTESGDREGQDKHPHQHQHQKGPDLMDMNNTTYIDLGHFHNRGRTIECLAKYFGEEAAFVHIRRNRYDIARSFLGKKGTRKTPCIIDSKMYEVEKLQTTRIKIHATVAVCPRSGENAGPVNLPVANDDVWDAFTPFQRFLWYVDEMEHRWYTLRAIPYVYDDVTIQDTGGTEELGQGQGQQQERERERKRGRPRFYEVTWNNGEELSKEVHELRKKFGCTPPPEVKHEHRHIRHVKRSLNCTEQIRQDLEYRTLMNYDSETLEILVSSQNPQHVDSEECVESREELEQAITTYTAAGGMDFDESAWVLPAGNTSVPQSR
jgi:hypothetical protein